MTPLIIALALAALLGTVPPDSGLVPPAQAVQGWATWYDAPSKVDAAAGPALRSMLGKRWRGTWVQVEGMEDPVRLTDWCACRDRHGSPTLIDLDDQAFRELAPLSRGIVKVVITSGDAPSLPNTDTAP